MTENGKPVSTPRLPEEGEADIGIKALLATVLGLVAMLAIVGAAAWFVLGNRAATGPAPPVGPMPRPLAEFRANEERLLQATEWIDRRAGVARIPVDRAMELLVKRSRKAEGGR